MSEIESIPTPAGACILRRSDRRTLAISVLPDGVVELVAPRGARPEDISAKVGRRLRWIVAQRRQFAEMNNEHVALCFESGATHRYLGRQYRLKVARGRPPGVKLAGAYFQLTARSGTPDEVRTLLTAWYRARAVEYFSARLGGWSAWCHDRNLPQPSLRLLRMPKRWGSARRDGRICLNPELIKAPSICIDYVIAHEVCHLKHPRHDRAFFQLLDQVFPDRRRIKARLETVET